MDNAGASAALPAVCSNHATGEPATIEPTQEIQYLLF